MLRISKLADYAIVILNLLAIETALCLSAKQIAKQTQINEPTVSKLLKKLNKKNLLQSTLGSQGGYRLVMPPAEINLLAIISAIEGEVALTECDKNNGHCAVQPSCAVSHNWQQISRAIRLTLAGISLVDMQRSVNTDSIKFKLQANLR